MIYVRLSPISYFCAVPKGRSWISSANLLLDRIKSITFKPVVGAKPYYVLPTGKAAGKPDGSAIDFTGTQAPKYSQFVVTIMYDKSQGIPVLLSALGENPQTYWVGKPGMQNGGFTPYRGASGPGRPGIDFQAATPVPEPGSVVGVLLGCVGLLLKVRRSR